MEPLNFFCETYYSIACNFIAWIQSLSDATLPPLLLDCCLMMTQFDFHCERENLFILDLGWSLRILWFATSFQSWTLYFLFGVGFISRRLENFIVDAIMLMEKNTWCWNSCLSLIKSGDHEILKWLTVPNYWHGGVFLKAFCLLPIFVTLFVVDFR